MLSGVASFWGTPSLKTNKNSLSGEKLPPLFSNPVQDKFVRTSNNVAFLGLNVNEVKKIARVADIKHGVEKVITQFIFLGPPASGKGTQTKMLAKDKNIPHIDTGGMLRAAVAEGTEFGKIAKENMDQGKLVPAEIVIGIVKERLHKPDCANGFILDGFPRSTEQAEALDVILADLNKGKNVRTVAVNIHVDEDKLIERIVNRRSCDTCGEIYNLKTKPPKKEGKCDCGGTLTQRKDDNAATATSRLETYHTETAPLIDFYTKKGMLKNIDGDKPINDIYADILKTIEEE